MFNPIYFWILQVPFHWTYIQSDLLVEFPIISPLFTPSVIQYPITFSFQYAFSLHIIHTATGLNIFDSINTSKDCIGSQIEEFSTSVLFFSSVFPLSPLPQINSSVCDSVTLFSLSRAILDIYFSQLKTIFHWSTQIC